MVEEPITIRLGTELEQQFRSWSALQAWVRRERAHWEWLRDGERTYNPGSISNIVDAFDEIERIAETCQREDRSLNEIKAHVEDAFSATGTLRLATSEVGAALLDVRAAAGDAAAAFAYAFHLGRVNLSNGNVEQVKGGILFAIPTMTDAAALASRLSRERANNRSAQISAMDRLERGREEQEQEFTDLLARGRRLAVKVLRRRRDAWNALEAAWHSEASAAVSDIRATEDAFKEQMRLQAPVEYWRAKAREHGDAERHGRIRLYCFFPLAALVLLGSFGAAARLLLDATTVHPTIYVIVSGGLASIAALAFWIGRLLTKLYLSERHLRHDAEERAVMTTTYLALTLEQAAAVEDRQIVLGALFRQSADGIVKEDGPPDISLAALIGRAAVR